MVIKMSLDLVLGLADQHAIEIHPNFKIIRNQYRSQLKCGAHTYNTASCIAFSEHRYRRCHFGPVDNGLDLRGIEFASIFLLREHVTVVPWHAHSGNTS
jgi:hypothetical protein